MNVAVKGMMQILLWQHVCRCIYVVEKVMRHYRRSIRSSSRAAGGGHVKSPFDFFLIPSMMYLVLCCTTIVPYMITLSEAVGRDVLE